MKSHSKSYIHQQRMRVRGEQLPISMFGHAQTSTNPAQSSQQTSRPSTISRITTAAADSQQTLQVPASALRAEVLWCLNTAANHHSYNSNEGIGELFAAMFSDSDIAKSFAWGKDKTSYMIRFGIAPHFKKLLINCVIWWVMGDGIAPPPPWKKAADRCCVGSKKYWGGSKKGSKR